MYKFTVFLYSYNVFISQCNPLYLRRLNKAYDNSEWKTVFVLNFKIRKLVTKWLIQRAANNLCCNFSTLLCFEGRVSESKKIRCQIFPGWRGVKCFYFFIVKASPKGSPPTNNQYFLGKYSQRGDFWNKKKYP